MPTRHHPEYEKDTRPSHEIVEIYRDQPDSEEAAQDFALVHYRGGQEEYDLGVKYSRSAVPRDRVVGAEILGQLGWGDQTFQEESVEVLVGLLDDEEPEVICAAAHALRHRDSDRALPQLLKLIDSEDPDIRNGVVHGLSGIEDPEAIAALIRLMRDEDRNVRDWATFGIGSQTTADSLEIRDALWRAVQDEDIEIRGEALVGLAIRKDPGTAEALLEEWKKNDVSILSVEAAEEIADPALLPSLREFVDLVTEYGTEFFQNRLDAAIKAAEEKQNRENEIVSAM